MDGWMDGHGVENEEGIDCDAETRNGRSQLATSKSIDSHQSNNWFVIRPIRCMVAIRWNRKNE